MNHIEKTAMAIQHIEANLTRKLDIDAVAGAVNYSKYHLHRMFTRTVGMTMHDYIVRRRLTEAAKLLVFSPKPILDIALMTGYDSQQAFHSAFKAMYKRSPGQYRRNERFYPLQLKFEFGGRYEMLKSPTLNAEITYATEDDIARWMALVYLVIDGFPHLNEAQYVNVLRRQIARKQALIMSDGPDAIGIMLFSRQSGSIDFMGTHPLYRQRGIPQAFIRRVMDELTENAPLSIVTFRAGDRADTGQRNEVISLGFAEAELLTEFGYPAQRFVLPKEARHE